MGTQLMAFWKSRARNSDPITSHEAAATITTPELLTRMQMVEKLLKAWPMGDEELVRGYWVAVTCAISCFQIFNQTTTLALGLHQLG